MLDLLALVRALVALRTASLLAPKCAELADAFAASWLALRAFAPQLSPGRVEAIVNEHAATRHAMWLRDCARDAVGERAMCLGPANDVVRSDAPGCYQCLPASSPAAAASTGLCACCRAALEREMRAEADALGCTFDQLCEAYALPPVAA